jgi:hypothetical protein
MEESCLKYRFKPDDMDVYFNLIIQSEKLDAEVLPYKWTYHVDY